jgi:hypothetical protein
MLVCIFYDIWSILRDYKIFLIVWYILWQFGVFLVCCTQKNLAILYRTLVDMNYCCFRLENKQKDSTALVCLTSSSKKNFKKISTFWAASVIFTKNTQRKQSPNMYVGENLPNLVTRCICMYLSVFVHRCLLFLTVTLS